MSHAANATVPRSAADMQNLIEQLITVLRARRREAEATLIAELQGILAYIQGVRTDLSQIGPELKTHYIPTATDELEAISETTAEATNRIMDAAEAIDAMADGRTVANKEALSAAATQIYEACTFQDLTGQRVRKIATALHETEVKIDQLIATFTSRLGIAMGDLPAVAPQPPREEDDGEVRACGPQLPGMAKTQAEIDALMEELG
ncbi:MAG TPA: protein phosphatase CheZ [Rhodospirillales bacterium]|nr:protein phosphatase CheZ [Rhodospirillales bacterium]